MGQPLVHDLRRLFSHRLRGFAGGAAVLCLAAGCGGSKKEHSFSFLSTPAQGRPSSCPDDAVDPGGPGGGPMAPRCSYEGVATGVQLRGTVLLAGEDETLHRPAEGMRVTVHGEDGAQVGRTRSDAQGQFSVSVNLGPGSYTLRAVAEETGEVLVERPFVIPEGATRVAGLEILLPLDPALR